MPNYCNFCKYFINTALRSHWNTNNDLYGLGVCEFNHQIRYFYDKDFPCFAQSVNNVFGIESEEYIEEWMKTKQIYTELWEDILEYQSTKYRFEHGGALFRNYRGREVDDLPF